MVFRAEDTGAHQSERSMIRNTRFKHNWDGSNAERNMQKIMKRGKDPFGTEIPEPEQ